MTTPKRGLLYHFTHLSNLASVAEHGIFCDTDVEGSHRLTTEVGQQGIKAKRRHRRVPIEPGGIVADYVPFYFAARSPTGSHSTPSLSRRRLIQRRLKAAD